MELVVDTTGSEGAAIEGTYKTTKVLILKAMAYEEVAQVKLFGDWLIRIKFSYTIKNHEGTIPQSLLLETD